MTFPEQELSAVAEAAHAVVQQAMEAGVVFGGGLYSPEELSVVDTRRGEFTPTDPEQNNRRGKCDLAGTR